MAELRQLSELLKFFGEANLGHFLRIDSVMVCFGAPTISFRCFSEEICLVVGANLSIIATLRLSTVCHELLL